MKSFLVALFFSPLITYTQTNVDSLWGIWENDLLTDTIRLKAIREVNWKTYVFNKPDSALYYSQLQYDFAQLKDQKKFIADALNQMGARAKVVSDYPKAIDYFKQSLEVYKKINDKNGIANSLNNIGITFQKKGDYSRALDCYEKVLKIRKTTSNEKELANCLSNIGLFYYSQSNYIEAISYSEQSISIQKKIEDKEGLAASYNNIAVAYQNQGNSIKAIDYLTKSLKIREQIGYQNGIADNLINIGNIYKNIGEPNKAIEYYIKSIEIKDKINNKKGNHVTYINLGNMYLEMYQDSLAYEYYFKSLVIAQEIESKEFIGNAYNRIGRIYFIRGDYIKANNFYKKSLDIALKIKDKKLVALTFLMLGELCTEKKEYLKALEYGNRSYSIAIEIGNIVQISSVSKLLYEINKSLGNNQDALKMYESYILMEDSIKSEKNLQEIIRQEYKYNYDKKEAIAKVEYEKAIQKQELEALAEQNHQKLIILIVIIGLVFLIIFLGFVFNRLRVSKKQNKIIENKNSIIEESHKEIKGSIVYAKRLQDAILPSYDEMNKFLPDSFNVFKPKDVVSGDFYWFEHIGDTSYLAAADCTGHGVPGAMVSVVCSNALNRSVKEFKITEPSKILDKTRELVIETFAKSGEDVKDGMDIALCAFKKGKVTYSGANNPLWIVRKTSLITAEQKQERSSIIDSELSLIEFKANRQPIGLYTNMQPFNQEEIELFKGDSVYFFTDGFPDQFGGDKMKKFKYKPFKQLLIQINDLPMKEQSQILSDTFENWKGELEQIDDVCIIGVRV